jgi:NAD(P)-dependent dehydrogenase (short-subunit alcohol dehydrogenase family)
MVSGSVSGIGKAAALEFARQGALVVGADLDEAGGRALVAQIEQDGGKAEFVRTDVSNEDDVAALIRGIGHRHGRLDVAFNNAGIAGEPMPLVKFTLQDWDRVVGINLTGVFLALQLRAGVG